MFVAKPLAKICVQLPMQQTKVEGPRFEVSCLGLAPDLLAKSFRLNPMKIYFVRNGLRNGLLIILHMLLESPETCFRSAC